MSRSQAPEMNSPSPVRIAPSTVRNSIRNSTSLQSPSRDSGLQRPRPNDVHRAPVNTPMTPSKSQNGRTVRIGEADVTLSVADELQANLGVDIGGDSEDGTLSIETNIEQVPSESPNRRRHGYHQAFSVSLSEVSHSQAMHKKSASMHTFPHSQSDHNVSKVRTSGSTKAAGLSSYSVEQVIDPPVAPSPFKAERNGLQGSKSSRTSAPSLSEHESSASVYSMSSYRSGPDVGSAESSQSISTVKSQDLESYDNMPLSMSTNSMGLSRLPSSMMFPTKTNSLATSGVHKTVSAPGNIPPTPDMLPPTSSSVMLHNALVEKCMRFEKLAKHLLLIIDRHESEKLTHLTRIESLEKNARKSDREIQGLRWLVMNSSGQNALPVDVSMRKRSLYGFLSPPPGWEDDDETPTVGGDSPSSVAIARKKVQKKERELDKLFNEAAQIKAVPQNPKRLLRRSNTMPNLLNDVSRLNGRRAEEELGLPPGLGLEFPMPAPLSLPSIATQACTSPSVESPPSVPSLTTTPTVSSGLESVPVFDGRSPGRIVPSKSLVNMTRLRTGRYKDDITGVRELPAIPLPLTSSCSTPILSKTGSFAIEQALQKDFCMEDLDMDDMFGKLMRDLGQMGE